MIKGGIGSEHAQGGSVPPKYPLVFDFCVMSKLRERPASSLSTCFKSESTSRVMIILLLFLQKQSLELGFDVTIIGVCYGARVLVVLGESAAPDVVYGQSEDDHLERIPLLSANLAPGVEHVAEVVKVAKERECCLLVLNLVSSTLPCIRQPGPH